MIPIVIYVGVSTLIHVTKISVAEAETRVLRLHYSVQLLSLATAFLALYCTMNFSSISRGPFVGSIKTWCMCYLLPPGHVF